MSRVPAAVLGLVAVAFAALGPGAVAAAGPDRVAAAPARINGSGSTYVALAMQQWVADAQTEGLQVNYLPTGSPQGLGQFADGLIDFAGTEAEFSALNRADNVGRGYQYVPDVAGAVAIMYNVTDRAGRKVDYLRLSRSTVAKIFMGHITKWSDPQITDDNKSPALPDGLVLPDEDINVVFRGGQSGTTALFYDFIQHTEPDLFDQWASRHRFPKPPVRIIDLSVAEFAPKTFALNGSDQIAQYVAGPQGKWSIAYDEFGYAVTYGAEAARIENASGDFVLPYAENIAAALESARLRDDLSQELSGVYGSGNPLAYPISAYSYIVTQCAPTGERATCKGNYTNGGVSETLALWMRYIACDGQISMAQIGYSPLPPNLSQELVNSIARMQGSAPEQLDAGNCKNPTFKGSLGENATSPPDVADKAGADVTAGGGSLGGTASGSGSGSGSSGSGASGSAASGSGSGAGAGTGSSSGGVTGLAGAPARAVGGGSSSWRDASPVELASKRSSESSLLPVLLLLAVVGAPPVVLTVIGVRRRQVAAG